MQVLEVKHLTTRRDFIKYPKIYKIMSEHNLFISRDKEIRDRNARSRFSNMLLVRFGFETCVNYLAI